MPILASDTLYMVNIKLYTSIHKNVSLNEKICKLILPYEYLHM